MLGFADRARPILHFGMGFRSSLVGRNQQGTCFDQLPAGILKHMVLGQLARSLRSGPCRIHDGSLHAAVDRCQGTVSRRELLAFRGFDSFGNPWTMGDARVGQSFRRYGLLEGMGLRNCRSRGALTLGFRQLLTGMAWAVANGHETIHRTGIRMRVRRGIRLDHQTFCQPTEFLLARRSKPVRLVRP